jgi:hypothetical protein
MGVPSSIFANFVLNYKQLLHSAAIAQVQIPVRQVHFAG